MVFSNYDDIAFITPEANKDDMFNGNMGRLIVFERYVKCGNIGLIKPPLYIPFTK